MGARVMAGETRSHATQGTVSAEASRLTALVGGTGYLARALIDDLTGAPEFSPVVCCEPDALAAVVHRVVKRPGSVVVFPLFGRRRVDDQRLQVNELGTHAGVAEELESCASPVTVVLPGSIEQYGRCEDPVDEQMPCRPTHAYAALKCEVEQLYRDASCRTGGRIRVICLRISSIHGPPVAGHSGMGSLNQVAQRIGRREPIQIYGAGAQRRDFMGLADFLAAVRQVLQVSLNGDIEPYETVNVAAGCSIAVADAIRAMVDAGDARDSLTFVPWPQDVTAAVAGSSLVDVAKLERLTGFAPSRDVLGALRRTTRAWLT